MNAHGPRSRLNSLNVYSCQKLIIHLTLLLLTNCKVLKNVYDLTGKINVCALPQRTCRSRVNIWMALEISSS